MLAELEIQRLRDAAIESAKNAYRPYSGFAVGAALLLNNDQIVAGCNIENASFGLTICAERTALFSAIARGTPPSDFQAMVIYTPGESVHTSCGACRQVISELMPEDAWLVSVCDSDELMQWRVKDALPRPFKLD